MKMLYVLLVLLAVGNVSAETVNNEPISIDGQFEARPLTAAERTALIRKKLEKRTNEMVKLQIQQIRLKREVELTKQLQKTFNDQMQALDKIN